MSPNWKDNNDKQIPMKTNDVNKSQVKKKWLLLPPAIPYINNSNFGRMGSGGSAAQNRQFYQHTHSHNSDLKHYWQLHQFGSPSYWWWSTW